MNIIKSCSMASIFALLVLTAPSKAVYFDAENISDEDVSKHMDPSAYPFVGQVKVAKKGQFYVGTGSMLTRTHFLTARHVVDSGFPLNEEGKTDFSVLPELYAAEFIEVRMCLNGEFKSLPIKRIHDYTTKDGSPEIALNEPVYSDIVILELAEPVDGVEPCTLREVNRNSDAFPTFTMAGYGDGGALRRSKQPNQELRLFDEWREAFLRDEDVHTPVFRWFQATDGETRFVRYIWNSVTRVKLTSKTLAAGPGDSGGPVMDENGAVFGIVNSGKVGDAVDKLGENRHDIRGKAFRYAPVSASIGYPMITMTTITNLPYIVLSVVFDEFATIFFSHKPVIGFTNRVHDLVQKAKRAAFCRIFEIERTKTYAGLCADFESGKHTGIESTIIALDEPVMKWIQDVVGDELKTR